jgi:uncharacterized protein
MGSTSKIYLVYDNPEKCTYESGRQDERRWMDIAMAVIHGKLLTLIYTLREKEIRVISFRPASREERKQCEEDTK